MSVWPAWEVRESGGTTSWFTVRLAFADGARVEALAVVADGGVSFEDVRARPALSPRDLAGLADWIEAPLFRACGREVPVRRAAAPEDTPELPSDVPELPSHAPELPDRAPELPDRAPELPDRAPELPDRAPELPDRAPELPDRAPEHPDRTSELPDRAGELPDDTGEYEPAPLLQDGDDPLASRRARPAWPRGIEGRWLVAQEYRAAQTDGVDPVLAVMCATGHSRRKSLRLISQARDAGFLTPRHARR